MFERFTEKARRVIFFARYEASQYGSRSIESEHLLLGLLREDRALMQRFLGDGNAEGQIRTEIEKRITRAERFSTAVEVPLTDECKKILHLAAEEAERLRHRHVGTEHLLLGILRIEDSLAARLLSARNLNLEAIREQLAKAPVAPNVKPQQNKAALLKLDDFLAGLKWQNAEELVSFFDQKGQFIDASGKGWNREELYKGFATRFAPYAKKNATYAFEGILADTSDLLVATILWKNAILASEHRVWMHRMTAVVILTEDDWRILSVQVSPVQLP